MTEGIQAGINHDIVKPPEISEEDIRLKAVANSWVKRHGLSSEEAITQALAQFDRINNLDRI